MMCVLEESDSKSGMRSWSVRFWEGRFMDVRFGELVLT